LLTSKGIFNVVGLSNLVAFSFLGPIYVVHSMCFAKVVLRKLKNGKAKNGSCNRYIYK